MSEAIYSSCGKAHYSDFRYYCSFCDEELEDSISENKEDHSTNNFSKESSMKVKRQVVTQEEWEANRKPLVRKRENQYPKVMKTKERRLSYLRKQNIKSTIIIIIILSVISGFIAGVVYLFKYLWWLRS